MKKLFVFLVIVLPFQNLLAQSADTAEIKRITDDISAIQTELNHKIYLDKKDNQFYNLVFPPANFTMSSKMWMFSAGVLKEGKKMMVEVTKKIDLNKMISLQTVVSAGGDVNVLRAVFPKNSLPKMLLENADTTNTKSILETYLDFYYPKEDIKKEQQLILDIYMLRMLQKQSNGEPTADDQMQMADALQAVETDNAAGAKKQIAKNENKIILPIVIEKKTEKPVIENKKQVIQKNSKEDSAQRRDRLYNTFMSSGNSYLINKKFLEAQTAYWNATALKPDEQEPQLKLQIIDKELGKLSGQTNVDDLYDSTILAGLDQYKKDLYDLAEGSFTEALKLKPESSTAKEQLNNIRKIKFDIATQLAIKQKNDLENKFRKDVIIGDEAIKDKRYSDAYSAYKEALNIHPDDEWCLARVKIAQYQMQAQK